MIQKMKTGDKKAQEKLVLSNLKLVLSIIQRVNIKGEERDDLFQVGCIGLIKALNNFNTQLNVRFSTYGVIMIMGEIKRYIRDNNIIRVSRGTKDLAYKVIGYKENYQKAHGCEPAVEVIAREFKTSPFKIRNALDAITEHISLYDPVFSDNPDNASVIDQISDGDFEDESYNETIIRELFSSLNPREKYIMNLRYLQGKTQMQVSQIVGISQAQVSRIEKNILTNVKSRLTG